MRTPERIESLSILRKNWAVAELKVSYRSKSRTNVVIGCSSDAYRVFLSMWDFTLIELQEQFSVLFLNRANEVIGYRQLSTGTNVGTVIDTQLIISLALAIRATSIIVAHNHPSGNTQPSEADNKITLKIKQACNYFDISLLDHLIVTKSKFLSYADEGYICV